MFNLKSKSFIPKVQSHQEANRNLPEEDNVQGDKDNKENCCNKMGLPQKLDKKFAHHYSNLREIVMFDL